MSKSFKEILEKVKSLPKKTVSVAVAQDSEVLLAVKAAKEKGIADSVLFGDAEKIEALAKEIGMKNTTFSNPHGLDDNTMNYSTAYDMALLSIYASKIPFYRKVTSTKYYKTNTSIKAYSWTNRNKLLFTYPYFTTGKTGYTPSAGRTFVSTSKYNDLELTIVSLNDSNIYETHSMLYSDFFSKYKKRLILSKED